jgi:uncharacterized protein YqiB (DUF1249 family)
MFDTLLHRPINSGRLERLMDLYERNYMLMRVLAPELRTMQEGCFVSRASGTPALELRDISHSRYTSTFKLTYHFSTRDPALKPYEPDLFIRLYHDARTCEVMSGLLPEIRVETRRTRDLQTGQQLNLFLHRWLSYCIRQGHCFGENTVSDEQVEAYCTQ